MPAQDNNNSDNNQIGGQNLSDSPTPSDTVTENNSLTDPAPANELETPTESAPNSTNQTLEPKVEFPDLESHSLNTETDTVLGSTLPFSSPNDTHQLPPENPPMPNKTKIATILSIALLTLSVSAGVFLVQRQQDIRERAATGKECTQSPDCDHLDNPGNSGSHTATKVISHLFITAQEFHRYEPGDTNDGCYRVLIFGNNASWNRIGSGPNCKDVSNVQIWLGSAVTPTPTPLPTAIPTPEPTLPPDITATPTPLVTATNTPVPTLPPLVSAQCMNVLAYDTEWNTLSLSDLAKLKTGDTVRFAVAGTATSGTFNMARFTINGTLRSPVVTQKPGSSEFYDEYIIPANTTSFTINAQIHHSSLGWF
jgi:hypothetical protein